MNSVVCAVAEESSFDTREPAIFPEVGYLIFFARGSGDGFEASWALVRISDYAESCYRFDFFCHVLFINFDLISEKQIIFISSFFLK